MNLKLTNLFCDIPENWQLDFQDGASPVMIGMIDLHHDLMFILTFMLGFVVWMLFRMLWIFKLSLLNQSVFPIIHGSIMEMIWTMIPCLMLLMMSIPSFSLLYSLDEMTEPAITIKITGLQWYWHYEYSDYISEKNEIISYDSYLISEEDLSIGQLSMLEVDNRLVIPLNTHISLLISAADVLHSFSMPSLGMKCDAMPGSLNQTSLFSLSEGVYYGNCAELCGMNHSSMPIVIESVSLNNYVSWMFAKFD